MRSLIASEYTLDVTDAFANSRSTIKQTRKALSHIQSSKPTLNGSEFPGFQYTRQIRPHDNMTNIELALDSCISHLFNNPFTIQEEGVAGV